MSAAFDTAVKLLRTVLGEIDRLEDAQPDAMLVDDLGADSLDFVELELKLEDLGILVEDEALPRELTVKGLADLITSKTGGAK